MCRRNKTRTREGASVPMHTGGKKMQDQTCWHTHIHSDRMQTHRQKDRHADMPTCRHAETRKYRQTAVRQRQNDKKDTHPPIHPSIHSFYCSGGINKQRSTGRKPTKGHSTKESTPRTCTHVHTHNNTILPVCIQEKVLEPNTNVKSEPLPQKSILVPENCARGKVILVLLCILLHARNNNSTQLKKATYSYNCHHICFAVSVQIWAAACPGKRSTKIYQLRFRIRRRSSSTRCLPPMPLNLASSCCHNVVCMGSGGRRISFPHQAQRCEQNRNHRHFREGIIL